MPFSNRVFCGDSTSPSVSEALVWLRQHGCPAVVSAGQSAGVDLLSSFWDDVSLSIHDGEAPLCVRCVRADANGVNRLTEEITDFIADVSELPDSPARSRVLNHLVATRLLVIIEFGESGGSPLAHEASASLMTLFVERADGLGQRDGIGFLDEDDEVILAIA
jgi:hypothetical protein